MSLLADLISGRRDEVIRRWGNLVEGSIVPEGIPTVELVDHLPTFLSELVEALRSSALDPSAASPGLTAAGHGEQRLRLGFSLDSVIREYGALRQAIADLTRDTGTPVSVRDSELLFNAIINGIANAVSKYSHQRDVELHRQHNEHVAFLAHELRNPLGTALNAFEILEHTKLISRDHRAGGAMFRALFQMRDLVDQALNVARFASGVELRLEPTSITKLLDGTIAMVSPEAEAKHVAMHLQTEREVTLEIDPRLIRSALSNLIRNAIKFTPEGGAVDVRNRVVDGYVTIEVEDSCGGLPPGKVEEAFAPFVRLDSKRDGFGLGLAITKQAVDAHAGHLRVQNLPGKGCIFAIELPTKPS